MIHNKKPRKKRTILTNKQKYEIANDVFKNYQKQTMVAAKYNITQAAVSKICKEYLMYGDRSLKSNIKRNRIIALEKEVIDLRKRNRDLEIEVEIIKKVKTISDKPKKIIISQKCNIANDFQKQISLSKSFKLIGLCKSTYYRRKKKNNTNIFWRKYDPEIAKLVKKIFISSHKTYGEMRIKIDLLNKFEIDISRRQVYQYMKLLGIKKPNKK